MNCVLKTNLSDSSPVVIASDFDDESADDGSEDDDQLQYDGAPLGDSFDASSSTCSQSSAANNNDIEKVGSRSLIIDDLIVCGAAFLCTTRVFIYCANACFVVCLFN